MVVKFKKLREEAVMPMKATVGAAAFDVYAPCDRAIRPGRQIIDLGFAIELPIGYEAKIEPRSGYSSKGFEGYLDQFFPDAKTERFDCDVLVGKIDSDYRGSVGVIVNSREFSRGYGENHIPRTFYIRRGQRIAQLTVYKTEDVDFVEVDELSDTDRGSGGFGHTGS